MTSSAGFLRPAEYETFDEAVTAVNSWLESGNVKLVSVETVVLPNIWSPFEEGSEDTSLGMRDTSNHWHQFIRCWYLDLDASAAGPKQDSHGAADA